MNIKLQSSLIKFSKLHNFIYFSLLTKERIQRTYCELLHILGYIEMI